MYCIFGYKHNGENEEKEELEVLAAAWRQLGFLAPKKVQEVSLESVEWMQ